MYSAGSSISVYHNLWKENEKTSKRVEKNFKIYIQKSSVQNISRTLKIQQEIKLNNPIR